MIAEKLNITNQAPDPIPVKIKKSGIGLRYPKPIGIYWYVASDFICSGIAWTVFYILRKQMLVQDYQVLESLKESTFLPGLFTIPFLWLMLYLLSGNYKRNLYERSRLNEFTNTVITSLIGVIGVYFVFLIDDIQNQFNLAYYYKAFFALITFQCLLVFAGRAFILGRVKRQIRNGDAGFNVLIAGNNKAGIKAFRDIQKDSQVTGWQVAGYIENPDQPKSFSQKWASCLGMFEQLEQVIDQYGIEKVVLTAGLKNNAQTEQWISRLKEKDVDIFFGAQFIGYPDGFSTDSKPGIRAIH